MIKPIKEPFVYLPELRSKQLTISIVGSSSSSQKLNLDLGDLTKAAQDVAELTKKNPLERLKCLYKIYCHFVQQQTECTQRVGKNRKITKILIDFRSNGIWYHMIKPRPPQGELVVDTGKNENVEKYRQTFKGFVDKLKQLGKGFSTFEKNLNLISQSIEKQSFNCIKFAGVCRWFIEKQLDSLKKHEDFLVKQKKVYEIKKKMILNQNRKVFTFSEQLKCINGLDDKTLIQFFDRFGKLRAVKILANSDDAFLTKITTLTQLLKSLVGNAKSRSLYFHCLKRWPHNLETLSSQFKIPSFATKKQKLGKINVCMNTLRVLDTSKSAILPDVLIYQYLLILLDPQGESSIEQIEKLPVLKRFSLIADWFRNLGAFGLSTTTFSSKVLSSKKILGKFPSRRPNFSLILLDMQRGIFKGVEPFAWGLASIAARYYADLEREHYIKNTFEQSRPHQSFEKFKNQLALFTTCHILSAKTTEERENLITGFLKISKALTEMGKLNTAMALYLPIGASHHTKLLLGKRKKKGPELLWLNARLGNPRKLLQLEQKLEQDGQLVVPLIGSHLNGLLGEFEIECKDAKIKQQKIRERVAHLFRNQDAIRKWNWMANKRWSVDFFKNVEAPTLFDQMRLGVFERTQELARSLRYLVVKRYIELKLNDTKTYRPIQDLMTRIKELIRKQVTKVSTPPQEKGNLFINFLLVAKELGMMGEFNFAHGIYNYLWVKLPESKYPLSWKHAKEFKGAQDALKWLSQNIATLTNIINLAKKKKNYIPLLDLVNTDCQEETPIHQEFWSTWYHGQKTSDFPVNLFQELQKPKRRNSMGRRRSHTKNRTKSRTRKRSYSCVVATRATRAIK